ncbi:hypothetical protein QNO21_10485 [Microbacterium sp. zg-Y818]|uniref:hypothetical protein n=1 Tax=unclassified Microbacterium TaxID=2609290 RepID=UPI00214C4EE5|nr:MULTISPECIES: hypothetical protein [unclassified Microbacterium]MCR2799551.1 hypothetical protein [Microbacterium sp. zg.Y818]WIM21545.1 hypothetical protein QNO21_10485 [Microbacterium sp. zg-Y818]
MGTFTPSVVLDVARQIGRVADLGIDAEEHLMTSSPAQFAALEEGSIDLAVTSPDNVLLYAGFDDNPRGRRLPLTITAALDRGLGLSLWTRPGIRLSEARVFGVDVPVSGFAIAGRALLERLGVDPDALETVSLGSTPRRRAALGAGDCDVTILGSGNELRAEEDGCHRVASVDELGEYLGAVACRLTNAPTESARAADVAASALVDTGAEIAAGHHHALAVSAAERLLGLSPSSARRHLDVLCSPKTGVVPDGRLERKALLTLARLRRGVQPEKPLAAAVDLLLATASGRAA